VSDATQRTGYQPAVATVTAPEASFGQLALATRVKVPLASATSTKPRSSTSRKKVQAPASSQTSP